MLRALVPISGFLFGHATDAYERIPATQTSRTPGNNEALTSIVFATAALEAFINELADFAKEPLYSEPLDPVFAAFAGLMEELEKSRASTLSKFMFGKWALSATPYDKGAQPYQDLNLLLDLRNTLVHPKFLDRLDQNSNEIAGYTRSVDPPAIITKLESKCILAESPTGSALPWIALITTKAAARWACDTSSAIVFSFLEALPKCRHSDFVRRVYSQSFERTT
jgi:hypothetical protein